VESLCNGLTGQKSALFSRLWFCAVSLDFYATLVAFGKTYAGADQIRRFWQSSGPFTHHWVGYTPAFRIAYKLAGSTGHLYFECLYVDDQDNKVTTHADLNAVSCCGTGNGCCTT
jgi:hypothetical protein